MSPMRRLNYLVHKWCTARRATTQRRTFHCTNTALVGFKKPKPAPQVNAKSAGPYGLKMVDYSVEPPKWPLPPHPPAKQFRFLTFLPAVLVAAGGVYVYFNQDDDIYNYWRQVEQGDVPLEDDDDEYDDDDFDEWEDEEVHEAKQKA